MEKWTFGICTDGINTIYHSDIVSSILAQEIPECEIIFCTENTEYNRYGEGIRTIYIGTDKPKWITKKKNTIANEASHPNICFLHDYASLGVDWYKYFEEFGYYWTIACMPVLRPCGNRWWDWATLDPHGLIPYTAQGFKDKMYVSGTAFCAKKDFMLSHPLNENLIWGESEDVEWSVRIRDFWKLELNQLSIIKLLRNPTHIC